MRNVKSVLVVWALGMSLCLGGPAFSAEEKLETLVKDMKKTEGLFTLYQKDQKLLVHIKSADLSKNYIVITSIAKGISSGQVLGGMSWGFGDDAVWTFKKVGEKLHVLRRNVRFKAKAGTPEAEAVKLAYNDSVLYALPILSSEGGGVLVDMTSIFMSDDQGIGQSIGYRFASDRSTWAKVKAFPENVELQVAAVYAGSRPLDTIADPRGVQVNVHYSISRLPENGYKPRVADDRVGYFMSVTKDFSNQDEDEHFVRFINRWDLQKADAKAKLSPPKEPIVFYLEKTVPIHLRPYVRAGIEEWNLAFRKLGFDNAIEVRQQREDDDWDPEDVRYNTFRWITAEAGFAMGPSRVNPFTGEILDADIIFDASFLRYWKHDYETFTPEGVAQLMGGGPLSDPEMAKSRIPQGLPAKAQPELDPTATPFKQSCNFGTGMQQQMGFAAAALMAQGATSDDGKLPDKFVYQAIKHVVMHEVGHTLGLRHNFKASAWKSLEDINKLPIDTTEATVASVMDYSPANIAANKDKQGPYYSSTLGPYDFWAIEYGYGTDADEAALKKIASRGAEKGLDYATDEDTRSTDSDPLTNRFDLGENPIDFARQQMELSAKLMEHVLDRSVKDGDGYQRARQAFGLLLSEYWRSAFFAARFPGGVHVHRDHKGDANQRPPFEVVSPDQQRDAVKLLAETAFDTPCYDPKLLNHLAASRWSHWGMGTLSRLDYPIHDTIGLMQARMLSQLFSSRTLTRLHDSELKVADDADVYTLAEHMRLVVDAIFTEWQTPPEGEYSSRKPCISSFRRQLQRMALKDLASFVVSGFAVPEDARTLSRMHLSTLEGQIEELLKNEKVKLDDYSRAHLLDSQRRIRQVLNAELEVRSID
jgi:hypothetical protein